MRNRILLTIIFVLLLVTSYQLLIIPASALEIDVITSPAAVVDDESIAAYIVRIYWFAVGAAGILAVAVIVGGAIYYMVSSGSPDKQNDAKSYITSALWGVALLLGSYLILNTINPQIVALGEPGAGLPDCSGASGEKPGVDCLPVPPKALPYCSVPLAADEVEGETCLANPFKPPEGLACPGGCFFDPETKKACDFESFGEVCTAIDRATEACKDNDPYPCNCRDCKVIPDYVAIKQTNTCINSTLGKCFLAEDVMRKLQTAFVSSPNFFKENFGLDKWRVTEAFPPAVDHRSAEHYNGRAFDIAPAGGESQGCPNLNELAQKFVNVGFSKVYIEGPPGVCGEATPPARSAEPVAGLPGVYRIYNSTPFHIHIAD
ncbi:MAG: hypothetical protein HY378_01760 [Candidatus Brennerbacteria bacterium]|nr:hypothetical protein [Candidatus Brennerbacteria bacterium]